MKGKRNFKEVLIQLKKMSKELIKEEMSLDKSINILEESIELFNYCAQVVDDTRAEGNEIEDK